jgi:hypothetical protein
VQRSSVLVDNPVDQGQPKPASLRHLTGAVAPVEAARDLRAFGLRHADAGVGAGEDGLFVACAPPSFETDSSDTTSDPTQLLKNPTRLYRRSGGVAGAVAQCFKNHPTEKERSPARGSFFISVEATLVVLLGVFVVVTRGGVTRGGHTLGLQRPSESRLTEILGARLPNRFSRCLL